MAEVFLAKLEGIEGFERKLAIKRILPHHSNNDSFVRMFIDEARLVAHFSHPNIVQTYDFGKIDDCYYISMEYIEGVSIAEIMTFHKANNRMVPLAAIVEIGIQMCRGIDYAHRETDENGEPLGIIHRDLTPHNILVSRKGIVKITDFGIAKASMNTHLTQAGMIKGKVPYMSPEQATGLPLTHVSDIFSIGIVMHELCTLERLFEGENDFATLRKVQEAEIPSIPGKNPDIPKGLEQSVLKALDRDRDNRHQWASEMEAELTRLKFDLGPEFQKFSLGKFIDEFIRERAAQKKASIEDVPESYSLAQQAKAKARTPGSGGGDPEVEQSLSDLAAGLSDVDDPLGFASGERPVAPSGPGADDKKTVLIPSLKSGGRPAPKLPIPDEAQGAPQTVLSVPQNVEPTGAVVGGDIAAEVPRSRKWVWLLAAILLVGVVGVGVWRVLTPQTGTLVVEVGPDDAADADIYLNGEKKGSGSLFEYRDIKDGTTLEVQVKKAGFEDFERTVEIRAGIRLRLPVELRQEKPKYGFLKIETTPPGAKLYLGGHKTNWTTPTRLKIAPGVPHRFAFVLKGYQTKEGAYSVEAEEEKTVTVELEPGNATIPAVPDSEE